MNKKLLLAILMVAGIAIWFIGWEAYSELALWQDISNSKYQNYLVITIIIYYIISGVAVYKYKPNPTSTTSITHSLNVTPAAASSSFATHEDWQKLTEEVKQLRKDITGLKAFSKFCEPAKEEEEHA